MKVSVIIPCYNGEKYLQDCLTSVLSQEYENLETIVINDGSEDQSHVVVDKWNKTKPLKVNYVQTENMGSAHARNTGLARATGDYIQFLDVDDLLSETKISHQIKLIENSESLPDIIVGSYQIISDSGKGRIHKPYTKDVWTALITSRLGITSSNMFKRKTLKEIGGFKTTQKSSQEYELMFRIMQKNNCIVIFDSHVYTHKRDINPDSISLSNKTLNTVRYLKLRVDIRDFLVESEIGKNNVTECENEIFREIRKLYKLDKEMGIDSYKEYIHRNFIPLSRFNASRRRLPGYYKFAYQIFGFQLSEKIYTTVALCKDKLKSKPLRILD